MTWWKSFPLFLDTPRNKALLSALWCVRLGPSSYLSVLLLLILLIYSSLLFPLFPLWPNSSHTSTPPFQTDIPLHRGGEGGGVGCPNENAYLSGLTVCGRLRICAVDFPSLRSIRSCHRSSTGVFDFPARAISAVSVMGWPLRSSGAAVTDAFWVSTAVGASRAQDNSLAESECSVTSRPLGVCCHLKTSV